MNNLDIQKENIIIITGSFNEKYNQGISIYCFNTEKNDSIKKSYKQDCQSDLHSNFKEWGKIFM